MCLVLALCGCGSLDITYFHQMNDTEITDMAVALKDAQEYEMEDIVAEDEKPVITELASKEGGVTDNAYIPQGAGVFSWDHIPNRDDYDCMLKNGISEIYQYMKPEYTDMAVRMFLESMDELEITVYLLAGEPDWCYESNYPHMVECIDKVRNWNNLVDKRARIKGIVFDLEPYVLDKWHSTPDQILEEYVANVIKIKEEAAKDENPLKIYFCIPYSYDITNRENTLRAIIRESDGVFVMNYFKGKEIEHISREAALCSWYKKRIVNIYELQPGLLSQTTDTITYYRDGLGALRDNYRQLKEAYPDDNIDLAYHTLEYLRVLSISD